MMRVWLTPWEWACCGEPFEIGDQVDFGIRSRDASELIDELGAELVGTVDALESHHEEDWTDRLRGRVAAVHEVSQEVVERRFEYFADPLARARPSDGRRRPEGAPVGARVPRVGVRIERLPETTRVVSVRGAPREVAAHHGPAARPDDVDGSPAERRRRRVGWLVDVEGLHPDPRIA